jgi:hypothetical protein
MRFFSVERRRTVPFSQRGSLAFVFCFISTSHAVFVIIRATPAGTPFIIRATPAGAATIARATPAASIATRRAFTITRAAFAHVTVVFLKKAVFAT